MIVQALLAGWGMTRPASIIQQADQVITATSLVDNSELFFTLDANTTYFIEWGVRATCTSVDGRFAPSTDATVSLVGGWDYVYPMSPDTSPSTFTPSLYHYESSTDVDSTPVEAPTTGTASTTSTDTNHGVLMLKVGGTGGTFKLQHRKTSSGGTMTVRAGSWLRYEAV
jgi:hypothetical protein